MIRETIWLLIKIVDFSNLKNDDCKITFLTFLHYLRRIKGEFSPMFNFSLGLSFYLCLQRTLLTEKLNNKLSYHYRPNLQAACNIALLIKTASLILPSKAVTHQVKFTVKTALFFSESDNVHVSSFCSPLYFQTKSWMRSSWGSMSLQHREVKLGKYTEQTNDLSFWFDLVNSLHSITDKRKNMQKSSENHN